MTERLFVARRTLFTPDAHDWGTIGWLFDGTIATGVELSIGRVVIDPGRKNPLHSHPNCEEVLVLLSGALEHSIEDEIFRLEPGDAIRVPAGRKHDARTVSDEPAEMIVCYSSPAREMVIHEEA